MGFGFRGGYMRGYTPARKTANVYAAKYAKKAIGAVARFGLRRSVYGAAGVGALALARKAFTKRKSRGSMIGKAQANIPGHGAGGTFSTFYSKRPLSRWNANLKKTAASNFYYNNNSIRLTQTPGSQAIYTIGTAYNAPDIFTHQPNGSTNKTFKVLLESCTMKTMLRNQENNDAHIVIYDIVSRRDMNSGDVNIAPDVAWYNGMVDTGTSAVSIYDVGATPFASPKFTQYFKVVKQTHMILPAGGSHEHRIHYEPNRMFSTEVTQDSVNFRNLTYFTLIAIYGAPDNDSTKTVISTGSVSIDVVATKQYRYTYLLDATINNVYSNSLAQALPGEQILQDESGTVQSIANA